MNTQPNPAPTPSDTPRTDLSLKSRNHLPAWFDDVVSADFARTLERELLSAQAALAAKDAEIAELSEQLRIITDAESFRARKIERERDQLRAELAAAQATLDWAETLLCNAKPLSHCTQDEWDELVHKWRDQKHRAAIDAARQAQSHSPTTPKPASS